MVYTTINYVKSIKKDFSLAHFLEGGLNALYFGDSFSAKQVAVSGAVGAFTGGIFGGLSAPKGANIWTGNYKIDAGPVMTPGEFSKEIEYTKSNLKLGREKHLEYMPLKPDDVTKFKEFTEVKGIRPDFVDFGTKTIYELKPFNPRQINLGTKQLLNYKAAFEKKYGGIWNTVLDHY